MVSISGETMGDFCFNEAHWLLAFFYFKLVLNLPRVLAGTEEEDELPQYRVVKWVGIIWNGAVPLAYGIDIVFLCYQLRIKHIPPILTGKLATYFEFGVYFGQVVSGAFLIWAALKIRRNLQKDQIHGL